MGNFGYSTDNHGRTGGNFAYSDGHAAFIPQTQAGSDTPQVLIEIFDNINRARRNQGGTTYVQSVD